MKITYLGTAAAEGFPAVFCNCEYCNRARELGGKNIRTRSQAIINDDRLIDLPADTYNHFLLNGILGDRIKYLFITHSHSDHFYPLELGMRQGAFAHQMQAPVLNVYCGQGAYDKLCAEFKESKGIEITLLKAYKEIVLNGYEIIPLPARHFNGDNALFFIIKGDKTILYAHDTGFFYDEVFDYVEKEHLYFDLISLDCTNIDLSISDEGGHMGLENIARLTQKLTGISAIDDKTVRYINHFSHNANPIHHLLEKRVESMNLNVAYNGLQIDL
ncbi:MAG: hypothetical protein IJ043_03875 [Clostridia bacterium]|nr:hypothetical protein [Clostridia bacterium]